LMTRAQWLSTRMVPNILKKIASKSFVFSKGFPLNPVLREGTA
jgi:hypothetical protein